MSEELEAMMQTLTRGTTAWPGGSARPYSLDDRRALIDLDPDLGDLLAEPRLTRARHELRCAVHELARGVFEPEIYLAPDRSQIGLLIARGYVVRELAVKGSPSAELLGPGDIIRTWQDEDPGDLMPHSVRWTALTPLTMGAVDSSLTLALTRYPALMLGFVERIEARARRLALTQAISQMTGVDQRVESLLSHLAERWGKVSQDGVLVPIDLSHRLLGALVGARRPTVSSAVALLSQQRRVSRRADGFWLLHTRAPEPSRFGVASAGLGAHATAA